MVESIKALVNKFYITTLLFMSMDLLDPVV